MQNTDFWCSHNFGLRGRYWHKIDRVSQLEPKELEPGDIQIWGLPAGKDSVPLNTNLIHYKEIFVFGTSSQSIYDSRKTLELVSAEVLNVKRFITHRAPLDDVIKAF